MSAITPRGEFENGLRAALVVLPGTAAWGLVSGVAMIKAGLDVPQAVAMTLLMYAGSAQLACLPLIAAGAPLGVLSLTAGVVNLRFIIYGLGLAPAFRSEPAGRKLLLGYLNADLGYALFVPRFNEDPHRPHARWLYLGIVTSNWVTWQTVSVVGIVLAAHIPTDWGLELAGLLALVALAIPLITTLPAVAGVAVAAVVALFGVDWPLRLGVIGGVAAGVTTAMVVETLSARLRTAAKR
jgi:predicted branched-subunit amino acid permease